MARSLLIPVASAVISGTILGAFWLAVMVACGIPAAFAAKAAAIGTIFAVYCWINFAIEKED